MNGLVSIAAFTLNGLELANRLAEALETKEYRVTVSAPERLAEGGAAPLGNLSSWTGWAFEHSDALVFVSACGIAVRAIAPFVKDKFDDPAVVSVDESGRYVVPLLSGHVGGANNLARHIASITGGDAVVSTATDVNGVFAVDEWAVGNRLAITDRSLARQVSAALLEGRKVGFMSSLPVMGSAPDCLQPFGASGPLPELGVYVGCRKHCMFGKTLRLVPHNLVVGIGCRKAMGAENLRDRIASVLDRHDIDGRAIRAIASIDVKADEPALHELAREHGWLTLFYSAAELKATPGVFAESDFVEQTVGVGNVCERAALRAAAELADPQTPERPRLLVHKQAGSGCTVALARIPAVVAF